MPLCVSRTQQEKPKLIDPLDYETVISELADELKEDPLRDLLLFPDNDFLVSMRVFVCERDHLSLSTTICTISVSEATASSVVITETLKRNSRSW